MALKLKARQQSILMPNDLTHLKFLENINGEWDKERESEIIALSPIFALITIMKNIDSNVISEAVEW